MPLETAAGKSADEKREEQRVFRSPGKAAQNEPGEARNACDAQTKHQRADRKLPTDALEKLAVHAGFGWGIFSGTVYNGNKDYTVTRITVRLTPTEYGKPSAESGIGKEYDIELDLAPLSKTSLSMPIPTDNALEYAWKVAKAHGHKTCQS